MTDGLKRMALICAAAAWGVVPLIGTAMADDLDHADAFRTKVNRAIDVLSNTGATPSDACVSALEEMHATDQQLKDLTGEVADSGVAPEALESSKGQVGIARDVLASDLENASNACMPDAERACAAAAPSKAATASACASLNAPIKPVDRQG